MSDPTSSRRRVFSAALGTIGGKLAVSLLALVALMAVAGLAVFSAFSSTQATGTSSFAAGTVSLSMNASDSVLFNLQAMKPGDSTSECVSVSYGGSLPASVEFYGSQGGDLAPFLRTSVVRGTFPGEPPAEHSCARFEPDTGGGEMWSGALSELPGPESPLSDPGTWTQDSTHAYEITVSLPADASEEAEGRTAEATFTWQAQNR